MENIRERFDTIYNDTYQKVLSYIFRKCGAIAEAEDILQEIYIELYKTLLQKDTEYIRYPEAFALRLAKSKVYRYYSEKEQQAAYIYVENMELLESETTEATSSNVTWEDSLIDKLTADEVMEYVAEKDELTREVFYQHYFQDKSLKEIAVACGVKEMTVKNRLYRTLKELAGMKRFIAIIAIVLLVALLAKPVYSWAENIISRLKRNYDEGNLEIVWLASYYEDYKEFVEQGVIPKDAKIDINGKKYTFEELEELWTNNPWLQDFEWKELPLYYRNENEADVYLEDFN